LNGFGKLAWAAAALGLVCAAGAQSTGPIQSTVQVDSNAAVFATMAAVGAACGLGPQTGAIAQEIKTQVTLHPPAVLPQLRAFCQTHGRRNPGRNLAQYIELALFLGNPPTLSLTLPASGLPPDAASVSTVVPLLARFWLQEHLAGEWAKAESAYQDRLGADAHAIRGMVTRIDAFFRIPQEYSDRRFYIFPDALVPPLEAVALNYQRNYYLAVNLNLDPQLGYIRHTYLQFMLDPLISSYPRAYLPVQREILPLLQRAPALPTEIKNSADLLDTECLARAVEIQLQSAPLARKQAEVAAAMEQGYVLTRLWFASLTAYRAQQANFAEFYPQAAFGMRIDELAGQVKHIAFTPASSPTATALVTPVRAPNLLALAQARFDAHDLPGAASLAQAALHQPNPDRGSAYFQLAKVAAAQNQAPAAVADFQKALRYASAANVHVRTWANLYLGRIYDAQHQRARALVHYRAALSVANNSLAKSLAEQGIKTPFQPPPHKH
jgi:tetratricopeptide (TPR) repeat protein